MDLENEESDLPAKMEHLYVLQLESGKYYVGKTTDIKRRIEEHHKGKGSEWTKLYKPVKVLETRKVKDEHDENNTTKDLMKKYGVDNVRGGSYSQVNLPTAYTKTIESEIRGNTNACFKCGGKGHYAKDCDEEEETIYVCDICSMEFSSQTIAQTHANNCRGVKKYSKPESQQETCYRCGREGHYAKNCYAYTDEDGNYIGKPKRDWRYDWSDDEDD
jgi:predicted GIY-YIG superfamily endonuclease/DNA-directed RNA polymerase subunit RPC12/RpoP